MKRNELRKYALGFSTLNQALRQSTVTEAAGLEFKLNRSLCFSIELMASASPEDLRIRS